MNELKEDDVSVAFKRGVRFFQEEVGNGITGESELTQVGEAVFEELFGGVRASDEIPEQQKNNDSYYIINTLPRGSTGEHWCALVMAKDGKVIFWDSFGRPVKELIPGLWRKYKKHLLIPDKDTDQHVKQEDCGARCLAFLAIYDFLGREAAMMI
jgi:hypothetical protein